MGNTNYNSALYELVESKSVSQARALLASIPTSRQKLEAVDWANPARMMHFVYTPLQIAVRNDDIEMAKLLLENGASTSIQDMFGDAPLHIAVANRYRELGHIFGSPEMITLLLEKGANINIRGQGLRTPLHCACYRDDLVALLLKNGADTNVQDQDGRTPLHTACMVNDVYIIKLLLQHGADTTMPDHKSKTPLDYITFEYDRRAVIEFAASLQRWKRRREMVLMHRSVDMSSHTVGSPDAATSSGVKLLRNTDVFRHVVRFI